MLRAPSDPWPLFVEWCRLSKAAGGADPHIDTIVHLAKDEEPQQRAWLICLYATFYNAPSALAVWNQWPNPQQVVKRPEEWDAWLAANWERYTFRRERRAVRTRTKVVQSTLALASIARSIEGEPWLMEPNPDPWVAYDYGWERVQQAPYVGRYITLKLLEALRRSFSANIELYDLRNPGGWSHRKAMAVLYPEYAEKLEGDDRLEHIKLADVLGAETQMRLAEAGVRVTYFELQVWLCEFKQGLLGRQYAGRTLDSEIRYALKVEPHWPDGWLGEFWHARYALFPHACLGELRGWADTRDECDATLRDHGYVWSDLEYDYPRTHNFAQPTPASKVHA